MNPTHNVRFWDVRRNKSSRKPSYEVRWVVDGRPRSRTRTTKALAENFLSDLRQAARRGEAFDTETGLPESMVKADRAVSWFEFVLAYVDMKWPHVAPKTRECIIDALATITPALVAKPPADHDPRIMRTALRDYALPPTRRASDRPPEIAAALRWLERTSLPVSALSNTRHVRTGLDALMLRLDGTAAAATTVRRKRTIFYNVLRYAVELEELPANPLDKISWSPPKVTEVVDRRVVVNPRQARELLTALTYVGRRGRGRRLVALFACMYYAGLRPGEAVALRAQNCHLPPTGWGRLTLATSRPEVGTQWSDTGDTHEERGLKHRADDDARPIPIPPVLVAILRDHITEFGTAPDGRLFQTERGGVVGSTAYGQVWAQARTLALTPDQVASPLAERPYDLRHAAVSLWLNAGVSAPEVAERAGHGVDVLLRVYAKCVDGGEQVANHRIEAALNMSYD